MKYSWENEVTLSCSSPIVVKLNVSKDKLTSHQQQLHMVIISCFRILKAVYRDFITQARFCWLRFVICRWTRKQKLKTTDHYIELYNVKVKNVYVNT